MHKLQYNDYDSYYFLDMAPQHTKCDSIENTWNTHNYTWQILLKLSDLYYSSFDEVWFSNATRPADFDLRSPS